MYESPLDDRYQMRNTKRDARENLQAEPIIHSGAVRNGKNEGHETRNDQSDAHHLSSVQRREGKG